jgi:hypothetical protein
MVGEDTRACFKECVVRSSIKFNSKLCFMAVDIFVNLC